MQKDPQVHEEQCAFPSHFEAGDGGYSHHAHGMSFLQYTSVAALKGLLSNPGHAPLAPDAVAQRAADCAVALMHALEARGWLHRSRRSPVKD